MLKRFRLKAFVVGILLVILFAFSAPQALAGTEVVVGSKEFTEQLILGQITLLILEKQGIPVVDETNLGGTLVLREAQEHGEIDLCWEYTGTALITHLGYDTAITDPEECYELVKKEDLEKNNLVWLDYAPMNNTYTIMMRQKDAQELGIKKISDLALAINEGEDAPDPGSWQFASNHEYSIRDDGYPGLTELYDFHFDGVQIMDLGITYAALRDGNVALAMGFATDGRIEAFGLVNLKDDKNYHPVYNAAPVIRAEILDVYPEIEKILAPISASLDTATMSRLNALVDIEGYEPDEVAEMWLKEQGLID